MCKAGGDRVTIGQLELPLYRSTAEGPFAEQERNHPAQMIIRHCGKAKDHEAHAYEDAHPWGCPGTPDIREAAG